MDSLPDGAGHKEIALGHIGNHIPDTGVQRNGFFIRKTDGNGGSSGAVNAQQQLQEGGLADSAFTGDGDEIAPVYGKGQIPQNGILISIIVRKGQLFAVDGGKGFLCAVPVHIRISFLSSQILQLLQPVGRRGHGIVLG